MRRLQRFVVVGLGLVVLASGHIYAKEPSIDAPVDQPAAAAASSTSPTSFGLHEKSLERIGSARNVSPLSVDKMFGDQIGSYIGSVVFNIVDVAVPGNNALPVELRRALNIDDRLRLNGNHLSGFADWDLDIPHLSGVFSSSAGGWKPSGGTVNQRCSLPRAPSGVGTIGADDYWQGYQLNVPGAGGQSLLHTPSAFIPSPNNGTAYPWITKDLWRVSCKTTTSNGYPGEAFVAISPAGIRYTLDWVISKPHAVLKNGASGASLPREVIYFLVTRVEDRHGNWVDYSYSADKLTGITSNDGRQIALSYSGNEITGATTSVGNWTYAYSPGRLSQVTQPDSSKWSYSAAGALAISPPANPNPPLEDPPECPDSLDDNWGQFDYTVTHPSGANATFNFSAMRHYRTNTPEMCHRPSPTYWYLEVPRYTESFSLTQKTVTGPGVASVSWSYTYGQPDLFSGVTTRINEVTGSDGSYQRREYGVQYGIDEGLLLKTEIGSSALNVIRSQAQTYVTTAEALGQSFPGDVGVNPFGMADLVSTVRLRPLKQSVISQQGETFSWAVNSSCNGTLCFDALARPTSVTKSSSLGYTLTESSSFHDLPSAWVLGQLKSVTRTAPGPVQVVTSTDFHAVTALPVATYSFGKLVQTLAYNADGTVATVKDGKNNTTSLSNWYRGIPQNIGYADGKAESAIVNQSGWVTQTSDANGYSTSYAYDALGRLASVAYPIGDTTAWNSTTQTFSQIATSEYGIPAGHWRQTISTGNARNITYFDALWRPLVTERYDSADPANTRSIGVNRYDASGRASYRSYPLRTLSDYSTVSEGSRTSYDALDRVTRVEQDSELGAPLASTTAYLSGLRTLSTNPRGAQTTTSYLAYDQPGYDAPLSIARPEGQSVQISRDTFGKPTRVRQSGTSGGVSSDVSRYYVYDGYQQLCKRIEPETGATVMDYDPAGNLEWSAAGLAMPDTSNASCPTDRNAAYNSGRRISRYYDTRNRLTSMQMPDGNGTQDFSYAPDGLPTQVITYNDSGTTAVINRYTYNRRRLLTGESQEQPNWYSWGIGYGYDGNASLAGQSYPTGLYVDYAPNALGQATRASSYATGVQYYPNGGIAQFTYGNSIVHTMTQNARQLPYRSTDGSAIDLQYHYDPNGNVEWLYDQRNTADHRYMNYDGLDRLTSAGSQMFGGDNWHRYTYDALDNLLTSKLGGVKEHNYEYDTVKNRLSMVRNNAGAATMAVEYDVQGNLRVKNGQNYNFDYGNRLRDVQGKEYYRYDAQGRRMFAWSPTVGTVLSQYSLGGQVMYQHNERKGKGIEHVYLGGSLVATLDRNWAAGTTVTKYQHTDALGSPVAISNETGQVIERTNYEPYGGAIGKTVDGVGYTGHVMDGETGLTYMQQRYYDPTLGRFLSVDPVTADGNTGGNFNRYWYANNNPYKFTDPDGRFGVIGALIGGGIEAGMQIAAEGKVTNWPAVGVAGAVGAVTGGLGGVIGKAAVSGAITTGRAVVAAAAVGGAAGATGKVAEGALTGKGTSPGAVAVAAAAGAVGGGVGAKVGLSVVAKVESMAASSGIAGHIGRTTQAAMQQGGKALEPSTSAGQKVGQTAADTASSYAEKKINK